MIKMLFNKKESLCITIIPAYTFLYSLKNVWSQTYQLKCFQVHFC